MFWELIFQIRPVRGTEFPSTNDISVILEISIEIGIMQAQSHYYNAQTKFSWSLKYHLCLEIAAPVTSRICEPFLFLDALRSKRSKRYPTEIHFLRSPTLHNPWKRK